MNPVFHEDKIELAKVRQRSSIARRNDNMRSIAAREFIKLIYGPDSVYARQTEYATIDNITRDDLIAFHKKFYHPDNMMLAVCGDFDTQQMIEKIKNAFQGWEKAGVEVPPVPEVTYDFKSTVNEIRKDDVNQSYVLMGHIGGMMNDPDYFALILMNRVLGSGFTSRLFKNVRSRMGLAYSAFGVYTSNYEYPGIFYVGCQTKLKSTVQATRAMINEGERSHRRRAELSQRKLSQFVRIQFRIEGANNRTVDDLRIFRLSGRLPAKDQTER
jgi:predicted Zn-dependent peptidase